ncbi:MAG TPA: discoidin domain-containing protein [Actinospica sp.]|nr:discoidin domain-containing protein [Actinospica sp.]
MTQQANQPFHASRRTLISAGSTLLAGFALDLALPGTGFAAAPAASSSSGHAAAPGELARYRPIEVSSTDYAPTPGSFAVDGVTSAGVRGTGWRAATGDPQWISVDLQTVCQVTAVHLTFEAAAGDPVFVKPSSGNWSDGTTGQELLSSYAVAFTVEVSSDKKSWTSVYQTTSGTGGAVAINLAAPVAARWVRMTSTKRSDANPVGLNGFEVYGTASGHRPSATGWTDWGTHDQHAPALSVAADGTVPLESGWVLTLDDWATGDGTALSKPTVDTSAWLPATVPGTVLTSLVEQGHLPDPVAGFNNLRIPEALSRHSWWYKRDFALPSGLNAGRGRRIWLEFDGVNHHADVYLNGTQVGSLTYPFARAAIDVTSHLASGSATQSVAVKITPMPIPGSPGDKGPAGQSWVDAGAQMMNMNSPTYLSVSGWDWMPAVRDRASGIWNHVRLRSTGDAVIGDPRVDTTLPALPDTSSAALTIVVPVRNAASSDLSASVTASFDNVRVAKTVTVPAGQSIDVTFAPAEFPQLNVRNPKLWWPNGYGDPNLHDLSLTVTVGGQQSDRRTTRFGIRQFDYEYKTPLPFVASPDSYTQTVDLGAQQARYVRVNCETRATGWGFSLWTLSVLNSATPGTDLAVHQPTTASTEDPSNPASNATDGNANTRWSSDYADNQWIEVDLGSSQSFDQVAITWEQAYARTYTVQVSADGSTWTDAKSVDNTAIPLPFNSGDASLDVESFTAVTGRYVRINCGLRQTSWGNSLWTLSVLNSATPGTDLAVHQPTTASTEDPSNPAVNATDGNSGTRWSSAYDDNQWIQVDLGSSQTFDQTAILWEQAYPKTYVIQVSDDSSTWTDVKSVDLAPESLKISVNGVRVLCRGGNWGWDELLRRMPAERMDAAVRMHRDMNFTMIRNWVASSNREEFFEACDEFGLLVWNDFPNAWGMDPPDHDAYNTLAADTVLRYRIHPSVVVWCGANEGNPPAAIDEGMRSAVVNGAPGTLYQSNSAGGNITGGGPYYWVEPASYFDPTTYGSRSFGFHTEIGMPVVSTALSLRNMAGDQPAWPIGGPWYYHDWSQYGNQAPLEYVAAIEARLQTSNTIDDFARKAQFVNFENARAMFEAWNANLWNDASGLMLWMSHPAWHSTVWQTYDYDFDVNGMYYGARTACEPLHVQADPVNWQVIALNHTSTALSGATVTAHLYDLTGKQLAAPQTTALNVAAADSSKAFTVPFGDALPDLHLLRLTLQDSAGHTLSQNTYWRYRTTAAMQALNTAPHTRLTATLGHVTSTPDGRRQATATVRNQGSAVAAMVRLSLLNTADGSRILPTIYEENYLWLLPGESRTLTIAFPAGDPELQVEAYNAPSITARS